MSSLTTPDWNAAQLRVDATMPDWFTWAIESPLTSRFVNVEGCPIHYLLWRGEDEDADQRGLLLVHGGGAHANWWRFIGPFFTRYFRVAALDLSGMGDSGQREGYNAEIRAAEIRLAYAPMGMAMVVRGGCRQSVMNFAHGKVARFMPTVTFQDSVMFVRGHNDHNDSRQKKHVKAVDLPRLDAAGEAEMRRLFAIDADQIRTVFA